MKTIIQCNALFASLQPSLANIKISTGKGRTRNAQDINLSRGMNTLSKLPVYMYQYVCYVRYLHRRTYEEQLQGPRIQGSFYVAIFRPSSHSGIKVDDGRSQVKLSLKERTQNPYTIRQMDNSLEDYYFLWNLFYR